MNWRTGALVSFSLMESKAFCVSDDQENPPGDSLVSTLNGAARVLKFLKNLWKLANPGNLCTMPTEVGRGYLVMALTFARSMLRLPCDTTKNDSVGTWNCDFSSLT